MKRLCLMRFVKAIALLIPIAAMVLFTQTFFFYHSDSDTERIRAFYREPPHSMDMVILGASDIFFGYSPVHAYEYCDLTSYMYAISSNPDSLYLPQLKEILSRQDPQLILIEVEGFLFDADDDPEHSIKEVPLRTFVENIPFSTNSLRTIREYPYADKLSCLLPFFKYHGEWKLSGEELTQRLRHRLDTMSSPSPVKGVYTITTFHRGWPKHEVLGDTSTLDLAPHSEKYLIELLEYCREQQLDNVVFIRFPHKVSSDHAYARFQHSNRAGEIIEEYGFPFLNLEQRHDEILLDVENDYHDNEHLNIYGQLKLTEYLSSLLMDEFGLEPMEKTPEIQAAWEACIPYAIAYAEIADEWLQARDTKYLDESLPGFIDELEQRIASWEE